MLCNVILKNKIKCHFFLHWALVDDFRGHLSLHGALDDFYVVALKMFDELSGNILALGCQSC